ncbi:hypothetical protein [Flavobacterium sp. LB2R40]|uniref:hypothetical protein n=1 Tax=Flavobacterium sp. LB2R40 TaxID=3401722 RepID=UPI003AABEDF5
MNNDKVMKPSVVLNGNSNNTIRHSVVFRFNEGMNELEKQQFFYAITKLTAINGVEKFEILKQVNIKNKFEYGISKPRTMPIL